MRVGDRGLVVGVGALLLLTGCSGQPAASPSTVVITRYASPPAPQTTGASTATGTSPTPTDTAAATMRKLPGTCDDLLPVGAVDAALGRQVAGRTAFVVGLPEKDIGRLGYLNCRYGITSAGQEQGRPEIEIGVSLYRTPAQAAARIPATVDDYVSHGATSEAVQVDGSEATVLTGGAGTGYAEPTLVLADGQRTVAVTVAESAGAQATTDLTALAKLALDKTAA